MVAPDEEAEKAIKERIEGSGLKDAVVGELMSTIAEKHIEGTMEK